MMGKTQDPPLKKDESATTGKGVVEIDDPQKSSHELPEDLNADELAAFEKIMGEIDSQEEEKLNGNAKDNEETDIKEAALTEDELATPSEDIEPISSEDRAGVDISDSTTIEDVPATAGGDERLDEDQQRAFESIMAQIESGGVAVADSAEKTGDASESEPTDDGTSELEKAVSEADTIEPPGSVAVQNDTSVDGLDQEQQQALESIMAQIEGDDAGDEATGSDKKTTLASEPEPTNDFAADLEKVIQDADASNGAAPADAGRDESTDDGLDQEQQQALESIMAQIQGDSTVESATGSSMETGDAPELETGEGLSVESEKAVQDAETPEDDEIQDADSDQSDEASEDISDDIEDILTEIAASEDAFHLPDADADGSASVPANAKALEETIVSDNSVARLGEDSGLEHAASQAATPAGNNGKPTEPVEKQLRKGLSSNQQSTKEPIPPSLKNRQKPEPLREAAQATGGRLKRAVLASVVAIIFLALAGYLFGVPQRMVDIKTDTPDTDTRRQDAMIDIQPAPQVQNPVIAVQDRSDQDRLKTAADNLDRLRNELIQKQAEIEELRAYYQAGIDAEIQGIVDRVRSAGKGTIPFKSAIADPHISLGLSAIQRRDTYIKKLEIPVDILFKNSEALLFFARKSALLALMADKTSDIDIDGFIKQADEARNVIGSELAQLNIDAVQVSARGLKSIWKDIEKRLPTDTVNAKNNKRVTDKGNATIWKDICQGDFSQKHKMTTLSPEAARCLVAWTGKDLFLSGLTDLSPGAARHLAAWDGDWLGLNGLEELSPEAAAHLSRWKGKGLSLNGLSRLSPRVVAIMSDWQGDQIELVNVKHMAHWENPKTRLFLSEGMKHKRSTTRN